MAPLDAMIKTLTATLLVLGSLLLPGHSATSSMKRGHNLDQWTTWTGVEKWNEPERARDDLYAQVMGDPAHPGNNLSRDDSLKLAMRQAKRPASVAAASPLPQATSRSSDRSVG